MTNGLPLNVVWEQALAHHRAGRLQDAEQLYRAILHVLPLQADANHNLGVIARQVGQHAASLSYFKVALSINPANEQYILSYSEALLTCGQPAEALKIITKAMLQGGKSSKTKAMRERAEKATRDFHANANPTAAEINQLIALFRDGSYMEMEALARQLLERNPESGLVWKALGTALHAQRKDAIFALEKAAELLPADAELHNTLADAFRVRGQFENAIASSTRALEINPNLSEAHNNLGAGLLKMEQLDAAVDSCRRALQINPKLFQAHVNLSNALAELGRSDEAVTSARRALDIINDSAEAHMTLGNALKDQGNLDEAIASYRRAVEIKPDFAQAHLNLGMALRTQNQNEAEFHCKRALEIDPCLTAAIVYMADLQIDRGNFGQAEALFQRAIEIDPKASEAWAGIARARKMTSSDAAWLDEAQRIAQTTLKPKKEVILRFSIAKYYDDIKQYDPAFLNFKRANDLLKQITKKYDRQALEQSIDHICTKFDRQWIEQHRTSGNPSARPVFIVGMPRSGTSLAEQIIASHPAAFGAGELLFWNEALQSHTLVVQRGDASDDSLPKMAEGYLQKLQGISADAMRIVDKMPFNFMSIGLILGALPNARIIHMQRDPIDTCLSIYFQNFDATHNYGNDLGDLAHCYAEYRRVMQHWQRELPEGTILHLPYEELIDNQEAWSRKMLDFIGLPWDPRCINFHETQRNVQTASNWQVRQKINKSSIERWRNYEKFLGPLLSLKT